MKISELINQQLFSENSGYYKTKNPIGKSADFITAPEISQIFGEVVASYLLEISKSTTSKISLVEMGAGRGIWFRDILKTINFLAQKKISIAQKFIEKSTFHIIEINPHLKAIQQQNLGDYKVFWHDNFENFKSASELDLGGEIYFLSNELLDCFAIDQFVKTKDGWQERLINFSDKQNLSEPQFVIRNTDKLIHTFVESQLGKDLSESAPFGAIYEYSKSAQTFISKLFEAINHRGGLAINIDYGYFSYDFANTLQTVRNHQKIPFFEGLKNADITALVDFVAVDKIAKAHNLNSSLISQNQFLLELGAKERLENLAQLNPAKNDELRSAFHRLVDPEQMGDLFKVHIAWR